MSSLLKICTFLTASSRAFEDVSKTQRNGHTEVGNCSEIQLATDVLDGLLTELQTATLQRDRQQRHLPCSCKCQSKLEIDEDDQNLKVEAAELRCKVNLLQSQVDALTSRMGTLVAREQTAEEVARAAKDDLAILRRSLASAGLGRPEMLRRVLKALGGTSPDIVLTVADWLEKIKAWPGLTGEHVGKMLDSLQPGAAATGPIVGSRFKVSDWHAIRSHSQVPTGRQGCYEWSASPPSGGDHTSRWLSHGGEVTRTDPPRADEARPCGETLSASDHNATRRLIPRSFRAWCGLSPSPAAAAGWAGSFGRGGLTPSSSSDSHQSESPSPRPCPLTAGRQRH